MGADVTKLSKTINVMDKKNPEKKIYSASQIDLHGMVSAVEDESDQDIAYLNIVTKNTLYQKSFTQYMLEKGKNPYVKFYNELEKLQMFLELKYKDCSPTQLIPTHEIALPQYNNTVNSYRSTGSGSGSGSSSSTDWELQFALRQAMEPLEHVITQQRFISVLDWNEELSNAQNILLTYILDEFRGFAHVSLPPSPEPDKIPRKKISERFTDRTADIVSRDMSYSGYHQRCENSIDMNSSTNNIDSPSQNGL